MFDPKTHGMGIGTEGIGDTNTIFVRKFRWIISGDHLEEWWIKSVDIDWEKKKIQLQIREAWLPPGKIATLEWIEGMRQKKWPKESMSLTTFDGCGNELYEYTFDGLKLIEDKSDFDYDSSDVSERHITISYSKSQWVVAQERERTEIDELQEQIDALKRKLEASQLKEAQMKVDRTPISFLNDKTWIPGKLAAS